MFDPSRTCTSRAVLEVDNISLVFPCELLLTTSLSYLVLEVHLCICYPPNLKAYCWPLTHAFVIPWRIVLHIHAIIGIKVVWVKSIHVFFEIWLFVFSYSQHKYIGSYNFCDQIEVWASAWKRPEIVSGKLWSMCPDQHASVVTKTAAFCFISIRPGSFPFWGTPSKICIAFSLHLLPLWWKVVYDVVYGL